MGAPKFMKGRGARLTTFIDGAKLEPLDVESWNLKPVKIQVADAVCGENRDRLDSLTRHYAGALKCFNANVTKLKALKKYDQASDDNAPQEVAIAFKLTDRSNGRSLWMLSDITIDDWNWTVGGRDENQMVDIPFRGTDFDDV